MEEEKNSFWYKVPFFLGLLFFVGVSIVKGRQQISKPIDQQITTHQSYEQLKKKQFRKKLNLKTIKEKLETKSNEKTKTSWLYLLIFAFITGLLTSFTPCIYPMIPITISILQSHHTNKFLHKFLASSIYVTGMAVVYACLGYIAATTSIIFGQWTANPWFIFFIVLFFLYLAFSMFGFYEMNLPKFLTHRKMPTNKNSLFKIFLLGMISGTIASPCMTPALAMLLGIVAKQANPLLGFATLFLFSLGLGILLVIIGTFSQAIELLPKAGVWMVEVKRLLGFGILAVCIYFIRPLIKQQLSLFLYSIIFAIALIFYWLKVSRWRQRQQL